MKTVSSFHPAALFLYFVAVLVITMFTRHPVVLGASLLGAVLFYGTLVPPRVFLRNLAFYFFVFLLLALTNPIFVHSGATPLFFMNGNPVTLEAVVAGAVNAGMIVAVLFWFKCYTVVMTSDKFVYLFGKVSPKVALMVAMALRFVPAMKDQMGRIRAAQKTMGLYTSRSVTDRLRSNVRVFSALLGWALENAVETADSMRARGYGLKGRSHFSVFIFRPRDGLLAAFAAAVLAALLLGLRAGALAFDFYPTVTPLALTPLHLVLFLAALSLMLLPCILEAEGDLHWKYLRSTV